MYSCCYSSHLTAYFYVHITTHNFFMKNDPNNDWNTSETLLARVKNSYDQSSWDDFDHYYRPLIYMIIRRMGLQHCDAEEVVQQVMLSAWKNLPKFEYDPSLRFRGWLCRVTWNAAKTYLSKRKSELKKVEKFSSTDLQFYKSSSRPQIEKIAEEEWKIYISNLAWNNIKDDLAEKVCLAFELLSEGMDPNEIAGKLEIERNSVYVYKKRVTKQLFKEISRLEHELN